LFESLFKDFPFSNQAFDRETGMPAVDVLEKDGNLILRAELPGMEEKDIQIQLDGNVLTLKGERKLEEEDKKENYHRIESFYGSFSRSFTLPETADRDKIKADYKTGILTVTVPQKPELKPRQIAVSAK
jgi:HSP20 family protein